MPLECLSNATRRPPTPAPPPLSEPSVQSSHLALPSENYRGQPALFLILAPPSVAVVAFARLEGAFGLAAQATFGYILVGGEDL